MNKAWLRAAVVLYLVAVTGCAEFDLRKRIPWGPGQNGTDEEPLKVVVFWTDAVMRQEGQHGTRGFGGRVMFYGRNETDPIKVEGTLVIYAFDESSGETNKVAPDRKFVFTPEQFEKHYSKSNIGHSYSIWVPWDQTGGMQTEISLIARFTPKKGSPVSSEQSRNMLPGTPRPRKTSLVGPGAASPLAPLLQIPPPGNAQPLPSQPQQAAMTPGIQQVSYQESIRGVPISGEQPQSAENASRMIVTSIPLAPQFGQVLPTAAVPANRTDPRGFNSAGAGNPAPALLNAAVPATPLAQRTAEAQSPPSTRFEPPRPRVLGAPIAQLEHDRGPWQPRPSEWPSGPASSPAPGTAIGTAAASTGSSAATSVRY
jgi:hypothetical protein